MLGGVVAVAFGSCVAAYERRTFDWAAYAIVQLALLATHAMTHYANEYYDRDTDALAVRTRFSGGSGILLDGSFDPRIAIATALALGAIALAGGAVLLAEGMTLAGALVFVIVPLAWIYSAPPRLAARGLGELDTSLVVAVLSPLCAYAAQTRSLDARALAATLPGAVAMLAMMACVEVPDVNADAATGKRTLVVRLGVARTARAMPAMLIAWTLAVAVAIAVGAPPAFAILEGIALFPASGVFRAFAAARSRATLAPPVAEALAARGVTFFFLVEFLGALGFASGLRY